MKNKFSILAVLVFSAFWICSCEEISQVKLKSEVTANELQAPSSSAYILALDDKENTLETFKWTATDYGFQASTTYTLEIDAAGNDFANAVVVVSTNSLESAITIGDFNNKLLDLGFAPEEAVSIDIRVVSKVHDEVSLVYSNVKTITVTPYATSFPPIWAMGTALNGWGPWLEKEVELQSSDFKKYETVTKFTQGNAFRFFAQQNWSPTSYNYPFFTTVDANFENANDGDSNFKFIGATGWYKINVDLKAKTVALTSVPEPVLYMVGAAINGWNWNPGTPVKMTYIKPGIFEATTDFANDTFRFFAQADWNPTSYNYPYFTTVDAKFENGNDGDKNFRFIGTPGSFKVKVDLNTKVVTLN